MNFRFIAIASLLLLAAFASVDAFYKAQTLYADSACKTSTGAYAYFYNSDESQLQTCKNTQGQCQKNEVGAIVETCLTTDPLLNVSSEYFLVFSYEAADDCASKKNYSSVSAFPFNTCFFAGIRWNKASGCGPNQNASSIAYLSAEDCANNINPLVQSFVPNVCNTLESLTTIKVTCPTAQSPAASSPAAPVAGPGTTPSKKASTAVSNVVGLVSCVTVLMAALV